MLNKRKFLVLGLVLGLSLALPMGSVGSGYNGHWDKTRIPDLKSSAKIIRDTWGLAHVQARNEHDLYFLQGYVHAHDRLFQMDVSRCTASGTLATLLGEGALASDIQLRTLGLRRAAERSLPAYSRRVLKALQAYTDGVNYFVFESGTPLPPEYGAVGFDVSDPASAFPRWEMIDSLAVGKLLTFGLSFGLDDIDHSIALQTFTTVFGQDAGTALFFEDLYRTQPFDPASTIPDSGGSGPVMPPYGKHHKNWSGHNDKAAEMARHYRDKAMQVPLLKKLMRSDPSSRGSNEWGVTGAISDSGLPIMANDSHLSLDMPTTFYPMHLRAGWTDVIGNGFAGVPFVVIGHNRNITWGATVNPMDVTDVYLDQLVPNADSPLGIGILFEGQSSPIIPIPEEYFVNADIDLDGVPDGVVVPVPPNPAIPAASLTVPIRNFGAIVEFDQAGGTALTVQYTGFGPTTELETFYLWNIARNLHAFRRGLEKFDVGSQNWAYADRKGNLGYFTSAEMPLREDLQSNTVAGLPPYFIRDGAGGNNEWVPVQNPLPGQSLPYEILPPAEMPHLVNPKNGWFINANNDPVGTSLDNDPLNQLRPGGGLYYLNPGYASGFRAGRITRRLKAALAADGSISYEDMQSIQADVGLLDAEFFVPHILQALADGQKDGADATLAALAEDPGIQEAAARMEKWGHYDFTSPTGIPEGYDAADEDGVLSPPTSEEIANSVATSIYSVWRSSFIMATIDATLDGIGIGSTRPGSSQALTALQILVRNGGVSASGVDFFTAGGTGDPALDTQIVMLKSLADSLDRLAGDEFAAAFGNSGDQGDYHWGKLHRIVFDSPLGGQFSVPPAFGAFPEPLPGLPGIPTDGGFGVADASSHNARASGVNGFMFGSGPTNRLVVEMGRWGARQAESVWPGGTVAVPVNEFYVNQLPLWLTNDTIPLWTRSGDVYRNAAEIQRFLP
jgi:penicillin amidase